MLTFDHRGEAAEPRHAATVVLIRDGASGVEVFLIRRHSRIGFMGGAYVFPGGKLDAADADVALAPFVAAMDPSRAAERLGEGDVDRALALHVAATRELFEEAGVLLGTTSERVDLAQARARLLAKTPAGKHSPPPSAFVETLSETGAELRLDSLIPLSRWITPEVESTRFDTRFFLTALPDGQTPRHDDTEGTMSCWLPPATAIDENARGVIRLPPPTLRTLECLAAFADVASVLADARARRPPVVRPVLVMREGGRFSLVLPGAPEHPEREAVLAGSTCFLVREDGTWFSARPDEVPAAL